MVHTLPNSTFSDIMSVNLNRPCGNIYTTETVKQYKSGPFFLDSQVSTCINILLWKCHPWECITASWLIETGNDNDRHIEIKVQIRCALIPERIYITIILKCLKEYHMDLQRWLWKSHIYSLHLLLFQKQIERLMGYIIKGNRTMFQRVLWKAV